MIVKFIVIPLIVIGILGLLIWATIDLSNRAKNDWNTLDELKAEANNLKGDKEELEAFHKKFIEKANKINNPHISPELNKIDGYIRGLYKKYKL